MMRESTNLFLGVYRLPKVSISSIKENNMTFEEILPGLKAKKKYVRTGWGGAENYVQLFDTLEVDGKVLQATPYFLIHVTGAGEGFSMWAPTPCDVLAEDWIEVND
ncbi:Hypothetical protein M6_Spy0382 [Streptococcus pyogenes MGAS10394]|nr:Hypothetical protein M6_Spy0382 [Streptococcus pyogenes MGAS10394]EFM32865.1 hypothetical protein HMPREF0841_1470 [Streptococcus pyogenes ATCC 10782]